MELNAEQKQTLAQTSGFLEMARLYAQYTVWSETLAMLAQVQSNNPQEWRDLLVSVGIQDEAILNAPLVAILSNSAP
ncbi:MAG: DUF928 domain-containing protein [Chloroflexaceae bacterium]|nr:DUF928 domain-containing protein [Chloroflexaceae bacterium]